MFRKRCNSNEKNGMWKGDKVGYNALHDWIKRHKPKPELCEECKLKEPYEIANISGNYLRDILDFRWLCRSCHMTNDFKTGVRKINRPRIKMNCIICGKEFEYWLSMRPSAKYCSPKCRQKDHSRLLKISWKRRNKEDGGDNDNRKHNNGI